MKLEDIKVGVKFKGVDGDTYTICEVLDDNGTVRAKDKSGGICRFTNVDNLWEDRVLVEECRMSKYRVGDIILHTIGCVKPIEIVVTDITENDQYELTWSTGTPLLFDCSLIDRSTVMSKKEIPQVAMNDLEFEHLIEPNPISGYGCVLFTPEQPVSSPKLFKGWKKA